MEELHWQDKIVPKAELRSDEGREDVEKKKNLTFL